MHVSSVTMTSVAITEVRITVICCGSSSLDESGPSSLVVGNVLELGLTEDKVPVLGGGTGHVVTATKPVLKKIYTDQFVVLYGCSVRG